MLLAQATRLPWTGDASLDNFSPLFGALVGIFYTDFKIGFMTFQFQVRILHHHRLEPQDQLPDLASACAFVTDKLLELVLLVRASLCRRRSGH